MNLNRQNYNYGHTIQDSDSESNIDGWTKTITIFCNLDGEAVGRAEFQWNPKEEILFPDMVGVHEDHRRRGIANSLYKKAEALTGSKIIRPEEHSEDAEMFWNQPNRIWGLD